MVSDVVAAQQEPEAGELPAAERQKLEAPPFLAQRSDASGSEAVVVCHFPGPTSQARCRDGFSVPRDQPSCTPPGTAASATSAILQARRPFVPPFR